MDADGTRCRYCGEVYDTAEVCVYGDVVLCDGCADRDTSDLLVEVVRLREALAWYADPRTWGQWLPQAAGRRARAALGIPERGSVDV